MTSNQVNKIVVNMLGYSLDTWLKLKEIHRITMVKWENVYTYDDLVRVYFDSTNELLRVCGVKRIKKDDLIHYPSNIQKEEILQDGEVIGYYIYKSDKNGIVMEDLYPYENIMIFSWKKELKGVGR